ncbi:hypothetical protein FSDG_01554 [Fusobacterium animalis 7_1]|uniref:Uncharacterized protein n=2 Tax=root TaxID=1 RepID=A0A140PTA1_9FUSO|nr:MULTISPECIES: hypothetical protein [Fusobacterium]AKC57618.1 hypothetical protein HMPREF1994_00059 [Fusobacterium phage Funu2]EEO42995.1 hypothetical protein FSDG_01554 [Fusobacterium animalis 7_1]EPC08330.1 hypothetical protein HMPREF9369_03134 [Fusobacterium polymorphum F0401]
MLNIKVNKYGVFFELNGEIIKLDDKVVDDLAKKIVSYICYRDKKEIMIFSDKEKIGL